MMGFLNLRATAARVDLIDTLFLGCNIPYAHLRFSNLNPVPPCTFKTRMTVCCDLDHQSTDGSEAYP